MSIYLSLSVYILSLLFSLVLVITGSRARSGAGMKVAIILHFLFLFLYLLYSIFKSRFGTGILMNFSFLAFLCSGLLTGGLILRSDVMPVFKNYFALFFLSLLFFFYSPSRFSAFLLSGSLVDQSPGKYVLPGNYYFEKQRTLTPDPRQPPAYKLARKSGLFHKTIRRDIIFPSEPVDVRLYRPSSEDSLFVRFFFTGDKSMTGARDSTDLNLSLTPEHTGSIYKNR